MPLGGMLPYGPSTPQTMLPRGAPNMSGLMPLLQMFAQLSRNNGQVGRPPMQDPRAVYPNFMQHMMPSVASAPGNGMGPGPPPGGDPTAGLRGRGDWTSFFTDPAFRRQTLGRSVPGTVRGTQSMPRMAPPVVPPNPGSPGGRYFGGPMAYRQPLPGVGPPARGI